MANNQYVNKVVYNNNTLIDLTNDDVTASQVLSGLYFHLNNGSRVSGTCTFDADTQDANATAAEILNTKTAYVKGTKITGSMPNRQAVTGYISAFDTPYTIQNGYHDGGGKVYLSTETLLSGNIKSGITILGVEGTYTGESITTQNKTVTPTASQQTIIADEGYDYLAQVVVNAVPYSETDNEYGGKTVTILNS